MLDKIAEICTLKLIKEKVINLDKKNIYLYGFQLFFSTTCSFISIILLSLLTGSGITGIIYLIIFMSLRITANGYHADTFLGCFIITNIFFVIYLILIEILPLILSIETNIFLSFLCLLYIWIKAPIEHPNHLLSIKRKYKNRLAARMIALLDCITIILFYSSNNNYIAYTIIIAIYIVTIMMLIKNRR